MASTSLAAKETSSISAVGWEVRPFPSRWGLRTINAQGSIGSSTVMTSLYGVPTWIVEQKELILRESTRLEIHFWMNSSAGPVGGGIVSRHVQAILRRWVGTVEQLSFF